jgi:hypothetical protein
MDAATSLWVAARAARAALSRCEALFLITLAGRPDCPSVTVPSYMQTGSATTYLYGAR